MNRLIRWDPFAEVTPLRRCMDRLFDDSFFRPYRLGTWTAKEGNVPLDMYQTKDDVVVKASLPGVKPEEVEITIEDNTLTIRGEVKASEETERDDYVLRERRWGTFRRAISLPGNLNTDKAEATFEDGTLTLSIPKAEEAKPRTITVKGARRSEGKKS